VACIRVAGIDLGSRTTKLLVLKNGILSKLYVADTGHDPLTASKKLLSSHPVDVIVATGYGRYLAKEHFAGSSVTEIKACALGANYLFPKCRTVIDVGGQDSKAISINGDGGLEDFEMNDRCAAGTGRFLEVMAKAMNFSVEEFGIEALRAKNPTRRINSMCTVFAESEVVSLLATGEDRRNIAFAVHQAIVTRLAPMINKVGLKGDTVFAGGVAKNPCIVSLLEEKLGVKLFIPKEPQILGALGAVLTMDSQLMKEGRRKRRIDLSP
jgi:predicted CoA-substrate-specific enzyme activase